MSCVISFFFFFNDTATTEIYTLSLHERSSDLCVASAMETIPDGASEFVCTESSAGGALVTDRKSTRLNSSHGYISYAVFCLKKKKKGPRSLDVTVLLRRSCDMVSHAWIQADII